MSVTINGTTGVSLVQDGVVTAADLASTLDLTGKTVTLPAGVGGKVLQVVSTTKTDVFTTTSASWVPITGMSVNITPSSTSSKILVFFNGHASNTGTGTGIAVLMRRGTTGIFRATGVNNRTDASSGGSTGGSTANRDMPAVVISGLDSPATTSQVTYSIDMAAIDGGTAVFNRSLGDQDSSTVPRTAATITVMEIAA